MESNAFIKENHKKQPRGCFLNSHDSAKCFKIGLVLFVVRVIHPHFSPKRAVMIHMIDVTKLVNNDVINHHLGCHGEFVVER